MSRERKSNPLRTFVFAIWRERGEKAGCSPAPTNATSAVQKSISAIPVPPTAAEEGLRDVQ